MLSQAKRHALPQIYNAFATTDPSTRPFRAVWVAHAQLKRHSVRSPNSIYIDRADLSLITAAVNVTSTMCERPVRDQSNVIFLTGITAGSIALAAVSVRTYSAISQNSFGLDDVFAIAAEAACLPVTVIQCYTPKLGFGKDTWVVPHSDIYKVLRVRTRNSRRVGDYTKYFLVNLRLSNIVLLLLWAYQTRVLILLPPHLSLGKHPEIHLDIHLHFSALDHCIRIHDDVCLQAYLSSMDFMGRHEHARLLYKSKHVLLGSSCVQHWPRYRDSPDTDSELDDTEAQLAKESLPWRNLRRRWHVSQTPGLCR